ncbi:MAG: AzlC family ABC transporter permease [Ruminococcaceae bacterium]|nr:AzlC family ABC transporter permease [Oscillospiraceae bacterium]
MKKNERIKENTFLKGIVDGLPICLGYISVAFAFGIFSVSNGLTAAEAVLISMTNVTSAGQLAAVPIMTLGGTLFEMALSQLVINLRYALMSVSLSQKLDSSVHLADRFLIAFVNTDEVFAVASSKKEVGKTYMFGLILMPYLGWSLGTLIGAVAGSILPAAVISALGIMIYGMFIAIVVPAAREDKNVLFCVVLAVVLSCAFRFVPLLSRVQTGFVIIICSVAASTVAALLFPVNKKKEDNADEI